MKNLIIDFNNYNGHQMVLSSKEILRRKDLHELELNMLNENTINSLLPFSWMEMDGEVSFYYGIEGYRLLAHYLRTQQLTMRSYYTLLLSIADGLATCYEYMLRPECCLIEEGMLYYNDQQERIMLAYLPLQQPVHQDNQAQQLLLLAVRWSTLIHDLDIIGYHRILHLLSSEKLPIIPLRQLLLDLIHELSKGRAKYSIDPQKEKANKPNLAAQPKSSHFAATQHSALGKQVDNIQSNNMEGSQASSSMLGARGFHAVSYGEANSIQINSGRASSSEASAGQANYSIANYNKGTLDQASDQPSSFPLAETNEAANNIDSEQVMWEGMEDDDLYEDHNVQANILTWKVYAAIIIILAAITMTWVKLYLPEQSIEQLLLCSSITAALVALIGIVLLKPIGALLARRKKEQEIEFEPLSISHYADNASARLANLFQSGDEGNRAEKEQIAGDSAYGEVQQHELSAVDLQTGNRAHQVNSSQSDVYPALKSKAVTGGKGLTQLATVQLDEEHATSLLQAAEPILLRSMDGDKMQIHINESTFLIGRAEEAVHFHETAKGVSRIHVELERCNGKLQAKDAGSRNGTYLNGQLMIAYKTYKLERGDKLQLASREGPIYEVMNDYRA